MTHRKTLIKLVCKPMRIKARPEEFIVRELSKWKPTEINTTGSVSVYSLRKTNLDTFAALRRLARTHRVPLDTIHYAGLKDRRAVTTQLISIPEQYHIPTKPTIKGLTVRNLGRSLEPISGSHLVGNAFCIVVRDLGKNELERLEHQLPALEKHGLINYFDDQRFGSLLSGKALAKGRPEQALQTLLAKARCRDSRQEQQFKKLVLRNWGNWRYLLENWGHRKGRNMIRYLANHPNDFCGAWQRCPAKERALHLFAYQSFIWNESTCRYLKARLAPDRLFATYYVAGTHLWPDYGPEESLPPLLDTFPLVSHTSQLTDPLVKEAVHGALQSEDLTLDTFQIQNIRGCFFKHEERPLIIFPNDLQCVDGPTPDTLYPGRHKVTLAFSLPPGGYATLLLKRLFGVGIDH